jgi:hypothetical protein
MDETAQIIIDFVTFTVPYCGCQHLPDVLVASGFFPASPTEVEPCTAIALDLLDFCAAMFERSGDAVAGMASTITAFQYKRLWRVLNNKASKMFNIETGNQLISRL